MRAVCKHMALFAFIAFLSAFLLFQVQPILGRYVLPWFGGGPAVWTSCLLFFQLVLLGGYFYAHALRVKLPPQRQFFLHIGLLAASLLMLPVAPEAETWKPRDASQPELRILWLLLANVGLPYLALSSTTPLIQHWFHRRFPERSPYRLFALANAGSLLALASYPAVFEPVLRLRMQSQLWSSAYGVFVLASAVCAYRALQAPAAASAHPAAAASPAESPRWGLWVALSACGVVLLMASTSQMTLELAVAPFLWVLPLALYLLSFVVVFESDRWYCRRLFSWLLAVATPAACVAYAMGARLPFWVLLAVYSGALFVACICCHGELAAARPAPRYLTLYYLSIAGGGALGGLLVAFAAPLLFHGYWELPLGLAAVCVLLVLVWRKQENWRPVWGNAAALRSAPIALCTAALASLAAVDSRGNPGSIYLDRNFYGVLRISERGEDASRQRRLSHGATLHGFQFRDPQRRRQPTAYYGWESAIGLAMTHHPSRAAGKPLDVGAIGLGVGTIAALAQPGDRIRFYEINPAVAEAAQHYFTFLADSTASIEIVLGDGRLRLETELASSGRGGFDILAVDAFSSGSIPAHLLTLEAAKIYRARLRPGGLLLFHVSNRYVDLTPVMRGLARRLGWRAAYLKQPRDDAAGASAAYWATLAASPEFFRHPQVRRRIEPWPAREPVLWTDDFIGLWPVLRW